MTVDKRSPDISPLGLYANILSENTQVLPEKLTKLDRLILCGLSEPPQVVHLHH